MDGCKQDHVVVVVVGGGDTCGDDDAGGGAVAAVNGEPKLMCARYLLGITLMLPAAGWVNVHIT